MVQDVFALDDLVFGPPTFRLARGLGILTETRKRQAEYFVHVCYLEISAEVRT